MRLQRTAGMGGSNITQEINAGVSTAGATAGLIATIAGASAAIPIIGPAVALVTSLISAFGVGSGCGSSCTESTQVVNQVIPLMQQNLAAAQSQLAANSGCLTIDEQAQLVANFDQLWNVIVQQCSQIGGGGGSNCITDRQRGGKYDCFVTLRDPISAMPVCATGSSQLVSDTSSTGILSGGSLPLIAAVGLVVVLLMRKKG